MGLINRIRGLLGSEQPPQPSTPQTATKRRRGRRGGRGRRRSGASANAQAPDRNQREDRETTKTQTASTQSRSRTADRSRGNRDQRPSEDRRQSDRRRSDRDRSRSDRDRSRGDRDRDRSRGGRYIRNRAALDAPLPEDIAFRPASEGGDDTILPGRRRPPPGARTTSRVLVTGLRNLPVWHHDDDADEQPAPPDEAAAEASRAPEAPATEAPEDGGEQPRRRRRGRRGGRGRRRSGDSASSDGHSNGATPADSHDDEPDDTDDELDDGDTAEDDARDEPAPRERPAARAARPAPRRSADIDPASLPENFRELGIDDHVLTAIARMRFTDPTPVQAATIPVLLDGRDVVGIAQTGTGKTLAFGVPMVQLLDPRSADVQGIVLVPTRELAQQVLEVLVDLAEPQGMRAIGLLGGRSLQGDFDALEDRPQIVVGTPGRVKDHLRRGTLSLRQVRVAILDEADQMLDIGFLPDITHILGRTPRSRQTALFSATMPGTVMRLIRRYMDRPETIRISSEFETAEAIDHVYYEVAQRDKVRGLRELIDRELRGRTLVFSRTRRGVDRLADQLQGLGVRVGALHGDMDQRKRDRVVARFREGELDILIATNVAARGLDIPEITHVVNYDAPDNAEEYVHRTGRTGRAGRHGKAISFVSEVDIDRFDGLRETFGERLQRERLELYA